MQDILRRVPQEVLKGLIRSVPFSDIFSHFSRSEDPPSMANVLVAYYGEGLLNEPRIRQAIFAVLSLDDLNGLCRGLNLPTSQYASDAALILASQSWLYNAPIVERIRTAFSKAGGVIPEEFLPKERPPAVQALEEVYSERVPPLFQFQTEVSDRLVLMLKSGGGRSMLQLPTGAGKTRTALDAVVRWKVDAQPAETGAVLWLSHSEELGEQAVATIRRCWIEKGAGRIRICRLWGKTRADSAAMRDSFIVAGLQKMYSLMKRGDPLFQQIQENIGVIVFDEAHKAIAPSYLELLASLTKRKRVTLLGLSATPGRSTVDFGGNRRLARLFGGDLIEPDFGGVAPIAALRKMGVLSRLNRTVLEVDVPMVVSSREEKGLQENADFSDQFLQSLGRDMRRNLQIHAQIKREVEKGRQCLVFACGVEHARCLSTLLVLDGISAAAIVGGMTTSNRLSAIDAFRKGQMKVLVNYAILTTGFDAPNVGAIIIARPTASIVLYGQMLGRGLRGPKVGGKSVCELIDIKDNFQGLGTESDVYSYFEDYWR